MNVVCICLTRHKRLHNVYTQADVSWHVPVAHDSADWPHSRHALVTRQPVSWRCMKPWRSGARQQDAKRLHKELLRAARARNQPRPLLHIMMLEVLRMLPRRSRLPGSCRLLIGESGVCGREVRWQPK